MPQTIRLGSRASALALVQANMIKHRLKTHFPDVECNIVPITSEGDINKSAPLSEIGGKGVFIKALEHALLNNEIDIAVHSFKDITSQAPDELELSGFLVPESPADILVLRDGLSWSNLPPNARIGTGSIRRKALLLEQRSDLNIIDIRGNVESRIQRCKEGDMDGVMLSEAGLIRLNIQEKISHRFDPNDFLPAPGQGVIAIQSRTADAEIATMVRQVSDREQSIISNIEYHFLKALSFNCRLPLAVMIRPKDAALHGQLFLAKEDLSDSMRTEWMMTADSWQDDIDAIIKDCKAFLGGADV